jgi:hypothetical protein
MQHVGLEWRRPRGVDGRPRARPQHVAAVLRQPESVGQEDVYFKPESGSHAADANNESTRGGSDSSQ